MADAKDFVLQTQNQDGGWGYRVGGMSYVEPTAMVLLALENTQRDARTITASGGARNFILSLQQADGGWGIARIDSESGWMTAWAVRALANSQDSASSAARDRGVSWLLKSEGMHVDDAAGSAQIRKMLKIDSTLRGWSWQPGDGAWVHPTALAILALVAAKRIGEVRVRQGIQYLYDRAVPSGGWNIGNPWMLDKQMPATIQDTAIALLALHAANESSADSRISTALRCLGTSVASAKTPAELAWGIYALRNWNIDVSDAVTRLNAMQNTDGGWQANPFITAVAMIASQKA